MVLKSNAQQVNINVNIFSQYVSHNGSVSIIANIPNSDSSPNCCCEIVGYAINGNFPMIPGNIANISGIISDISIHFMAQPKSNPYTLKFIVEGSCIDGSELKYGTGATGANWGTFNEMGTLTKDNNEISLDCNLPTHFYVNIANASNRVEPVEFIHKVGLNIVHISAENKHVVSPPVMMISQCNDNTIMLICPDVPSPSCNYMDLTIYITFNYIIPPGSCNTFLTINASNILCPNEPIQGYR